MFRLFAAFGDSARPLKKATHLWQAGKEIGIAK
jgi:hypothetical protein